MSDTRSISEPKLFGITENSLSLVFGVAEGDQLVDAEATVRLNGDVRAVSKQPGTRLVRIDDLEPATEYEIEILSDGACAEPNRYLPAKVRTLAAPSAAEVASFATLNDLHFGEARMGGMLTKDHEYGDARPGFPVVCDADYDAPYAEFMNADAIAEINRLDVDCTVIKGDIADRGLPEQFETAARTFAAFEKPHHPFLGNHDYLQRNKGIEVDGYGILGAQPAPRSFEVEGWLLVLLDTTIPGEHHGSFDQARRDWLAETLSDGQRRGQPTLLFSHHQPVPPEHRDSYPNAIGMDPADSVALFDLLADAPHVKGMLIGHTHRNRIRRYPPTGKLPFVEVNNPKDYPGGFGHYRLFEDGSFRQEVRRTPSPRALEHSTRCRSLFQGSFQHFVLGTLEERSYVAEA
ncbi:MAG: metallophosphoesterase [Myxococcota bacterium]|nr:metallophosphoesterase [Myxococcota bacterium]